MRRCSPSSIICPGWVCCWPLIEEHGGDLRSGRRRPDRGHPHVLRIMRVPRHHGHSYGGRNQLCQLRDACVHLAFLRMPVLGMPSHCEIRFAAEVHQECPIEHRVNHLRIVLLQKTLPETCDDGLTIFTQDLHGTVQSADAEPRGPRCLWMGSCIAKSWHLRIEKLSPTLYPTISLANLDRSVRLVLNMRITSSKPKRSKNAWAHMRLPIGTDKLSFSLTLNVLKRVCLVINLDFRTLYSSFPSVCRFLTSSLICNESERSVKVMLKNDGGHPVSKAFRHLLGYQD